MNTLSYNLPNDIYTYVMTCTDEQLDAFTQLLIDEGAYKIVLNNEEIYNVKKDKKVGNTMNTLTYNLKNDFNTYEMTCNDDALDMYIELLFDNGAYRVNLNNKVVFGSKSTYEVWKDEK